MGKASDAKAPKGKVAKVGAVAKDDPKDARMTLVADWLRNEKKSGLHTKEAVQYEKRVEYFKGSKLVDALLSPKYKGKVAKTVPIKSRAEAAKLAQEMLRLGFFHRSQRVTHAHTRRWELELVNGPFEEDGLFTWVYEGSKTKLYLMCAGLMIGALGLCMIQIWPLWLKIGVWWCSVTFLTTFGVLCVVRLILFCLMWIVGFRGIWLFPNLFDDNQTFAGSFMPVFGKARFAFNSGSDLTPRPCTKFQACAQLTQLAASVITLSNSESSGRSTGLASTSEMRSWGGHRM